MKRDRQLDRVCDDVPLERNHGLRHKLVECRADTPEVPEPLLTHSEGDGTGSEVVSAEEVLDNRDGRCDRGGVVADARSCLKAGVRASLMT
jgi:hypothetical protein